MIGFICGRIYVPRYSNGDQEILGILQFKKAGEKSLLLLFYQLGPL
jgi:hypothetical protein